MERELHCIASRSIRTSGSMYAEHWSQYYISDVGHVVHLHQAVRIGKGSPHRSDRAVCHVVDMSARCTAGFCST